MSTESAKSQDVVTADVVQGGSVGAAAAAHGEYQVQCFDKDGNLKWEDRGPNLVVNVGLQDMNTKYFKGSTYTAAWYIGLYGASGSNTPAATDTMSSHAGWTEITDYSQSTRPQCNFGTPTTADPSVATNSGSATQFSITGTGLVQIRRALFGR